MKNKNDKNHRYEEKAVDEEEIISPAAHFRDRAAERRKGNTDDLGFAKTQELVNKLLNKHSEQPFAFNRELDHTKKEVKQEKKPVVEEDDDFDIFEDLPAPQSGPKETKEVKLFEDSQKTRKLLTDEQKKHEKSKELSEKKDLNKKVEKILNKQKLEDSYFDEDLLNDQNGVSLYAFDEEDLEEEEEDWDALKQNLSDLKNNLYTDTKKGKSDKDLKNISNQKFGRELQQIDSLMKRKYGEGFQDSSKKSKNK